MKTFLKWFFGAVLLVVVLAVVLLLSLDTILRVTAAGQIAYANNVSRPLLLAWGSEQGGALPPEWAGQVTEVLEQGEPRERTMDIAGQAYALLFAPIRDLGYVNIYARDITAVRRADAVVLQFGDGHAGPCSARFHFDPFNPIGRGKPIVLATIANQRVHSSPFFRSSSKAAANAP